MDDYSKKTSPEQRMELEGTTQETKNLFIMEQEKQTTIDPKYWASLHVEGIDDEKQPAAAVAATSQVYNNCQTDTGAEMREVARRVVERGIDITAGYGNWMKLGFAIAAEMGEGGREIYHQLSAMNGSYDSAECDAQYTKCLRGRGSGVSARTFFYMAKEKAGIDLGEIAHNQHAGRAVSATCANVPSLAKGEKEGNNAVFSSSGDGWHLAHLAQTAQTEPGRKGDGYTFSDKLRAADLESKIMSRIHEQYKDEPAKCDAVMLAALNVISGMLGGASATSGKLPGIYGLYDQRRVYAPLFNIIYSTAGNDKGSLSSVSEMAYRVKGEMRSKYEEEKREYDRAMAEWEAKGKKERGEVPREPVFRSPFVPGNSSSSAVYRGLHANGGWGIMFETEADTVTAMISSDYGNYSDLMRKSHHHETLSMSRVTDKLHIEIEKPRLSVLLTCTPGQMRGLFPSFENGLGSRFLFYRIPDEDVRFHNVFAQNSVPLEDMFRQMGDSLLPLLHAIQQREDRPLQFVMSKAQQEEFQKIYGDMLQEQFAMYGIGMRAFVFRIALQSFRYAMILTALRRLDEWARSFNSSDPQDMFLEYENALVCDDRDFRTAITIVDCLINHTARVYAALADKSDNPFAAKGISLTANEASLYNALPEGEFRTGEALEAAAALNIPERTAKRMLRRFKDEYNIVVPLCHGRYRKSAGEEEKV